VLLQFRSKFRVLALAALFGIAPLWLQASADSVVLPGSEAHVYRNLSPVPLQLYVFKPADWKPGDRRTALIWFFGGGFTIGTPHDAAPWASWAAGLGIVGVAPDYRVKSRFGTTPIEAVADGRAAVRWIESHAPELGIDSQRIVVGGISAGGLLALWAGISHAPPGSAPEESPRIKPAAIILSSPVSDMSHSDSLTKYYTWALSAVHQLDAKMPVILLFHGSADQNVPYLESVTLYDKLAASGNFCEFVTIRGGSHNFVGDNPAYTSRTRAIVRQFLIEQRLIAK
jgi:acetyl esterase